MWWIHEFTTLGGQKRYALGEPFSQRLMGALSRRVAVNSKAVAHYYSPPIPAGKITLVELGVETPVVAPNCIVANRLRILMLGRKDRAKGCEDAIRALASIRHEDLDVTLRMVGPSMPGYAETLWYLARDLDVLDRVEFPEYVPYPRDELSRSNVVLTCSADEGFGRVAVEAMKGGRPVIGARSGATVELIEDGFDGLLFEAGNTADIAAAIRRCAGDPGLVQTMSRNAIVRNAERFTIAGEVDTFVDLFNEVYRG